MDDTAAATKIQAMQRGREARAEVEELKEQTKAATQIQAIQRGKEDRAKVKQLKADKVSAAAGASANAGADAGEEKKKKKKKKKKRKKRISIAIMGPPGVGKTTQAAMIAKHYDAVLLGNLESILDWVVVEKHKCGDDVQKARDAGTSIPAATVVQALVERLALDDVKEAPAWIVENFPQNREQMEELMRVAASKKSPLLHFISLRAPADIVHMHLEDQARSLDEGKRSADEKTIVPDEEALSQMIVDYEKLLPEITTWIQENEERFKLKFLDLQDEHGTVSFFYF
jgi:adenylate kinase